MKKLFVFVLCLALFVCSCAFAEPVDLAVNGSAVITSQPDVVTISVCAEATRPTVSECQQELSGIVADMIDALNEIGVADEDVSTSYYNVYPTYDYDNNNAINGYQASHSMQITCRDMEKLNDVINTISESGITNINSIEFSVSNRSELYQQALAKALEQAVSKANALAASSGFESVALVSVNENAEAYYNMYSDSLMAKAEEAAGAFDAGIRSSNVSVTASVTAHFNVE